MKVINIEQARQQLASVLEQAQTETVCLTRHGRPVAIIAGVEGADIGSVLQRDPELRKKLGLPQAKKAG